MNIIIISIITIIINIRLFLNGHRENRPFKKLFLCSLLLVHSLRGKRQLHRLLPSMPLLLPLLLPPLQLAPLLQLRLGGADDRRSKPPQSDRIITGARLSIRPMLSQKCLSLILRAPICLCNPLEAKGENASFCGPI